MRARLPRPVEPDGPTRFVPLPDVVPASSRRASPMPAQADSGRSNRRSATEFFELAQRAAKSDPPRYALASHVPPGQSSTGSPTIPRRSRLLGYVPYEGGWARPFAVQQLKKGYVDHPTFGWVKADWVPAPRSWRAACRRRSRGKVRWLPAAEADRLRADWNPPWQISTEHFEIQTNVTLADAIGFGRRLEAFHDLFMALLADVLGDNLPLARRFRNPR